jgi:hypothetical protein
MERARESTKRRKVSWKPNREIVHRGRSEGGNKKEKEGAERGTDLEVELVTLSSEPVVDQLSDKGVLLGGSDVLLTELKEPESMKFLEGSQTEFFDRPGSL